MVYKQLHQSFIKEVMYRHDHDPSSIGALKTALFIGLEGVQSTDGMNPNKALQVAAHRLLLPINRSSHGFSKWTNSYKIGEIHQIHFDCQFDIGDWIRYMYIYLMSDFCYDCDADNSMCLPSMSMLRWRSDPSQ